MLASDTGELLRAFESGRTRRVPTLPGTAEAGPPQGIFRGLGWVAGKNRQVRCSRSAESFVIDVDAVGRFGVARDGASVGCLGADARATADEVAEAAVGPPLVLALALQGAFCLHASAVTDGRRLIAFAGPSGSGKSTLARMLAGQPTSPWQRAADDVLPFEAEADRPVALPRFPQLKLARDNQPWQSLPDRVELTAVCWLTEPSAPQRPGNVVMERLGIRDSTVALVAHTVAARLFDPELHQRHLAACARAAAACQVFRLSCPWGVERLPRVAGALAALVSG